jgi:hypothetical protein
LDAIFARLSTSTVLHAGKLYWLLTLHSSCHQSPAYFVWQIPWCVSPCYAISTSNWLWMQPVCGYWTFRLALWFSWYISCTIDSETLIKHIYCIFSHAQQYLEAVDCFSVAMQLVSSTLSQDLVLYLLLADILHRGSKLMAWEISRSKDGILIYTERVLISWDPGG